MAQYRVLNKNFPETSTKKSTYIGVKEVVSEEDISDRIMGVKTSDRIHGDGSAVGRRRR